MKLKVTRSSGNVFRDLGFPAEEAEHLKIRSDLMIQLQKLITSRGLKQAETAKLLRVIQPRVSDAELPPLIGCSPRLSGCAAVGPGAS